MWHCASAIRPKRPVIQEEIKGIASNLERARERDRELTIVSPRAGAFIAAGRAAHGLAASSRRAKVIGYVIDPCRLSDGAHDDQPE
jgi:hypothetical protein